MSGLDPRSVKVMPNYVKIHNPTFCIEPLLSRPVLSQDSKNVIQFLVRQLNMPNIAIKTVTSPRLYFLEAKKDIALKMCIPVVGIQIYNICSDF